MKVQLTPTAEKQLLKLKRSEAKKVDKKLRLLSVAPMCGKKLEGKLKNRYSLRAWPYRIIYVVNKNAVRVEVEFIEHRQGAYK